MNRLDGKVCLVTGSASGIGKRIAEVYATNGGKVVVADLKLDAAQATLVRTEADFSRTDTLAKSDYSSKATLDAARAARDSAKAQVAAQSAATSRRAASATAASSA